MDIFRYLEKDDSSLLVFDDQKIHLEYTGEEKTEKLWKLATSINVIYPDTTFDIHPKTTKPLVKSM